MTPHHRLFLEYVAELRLAQMHALTWWQDLARREAASVGDAQAAEQRIQRRWPFGPTSHPIVLAVYRKYFIACERLNESIQMQASPTQGASSEDDWGVEDLNELAGGDDVDREAAFWNSLGPVDPPVFLVELLYGRQDDLGDFLAYLVYSPIGERDNRSV